MTESINNSSFLNLMAGHRLMLGFEGTRFNRDLENIIKNINAAGIILFKRNIESPEQLETLCRSCQDFAHSLGLPPLFIAVDQEGGAVARLKEPFTVFRGNPYIKTIEDAENFAETTARELRQVGINMNFAPVLDVAPKGVDSIMKDRVFTGDARRVSELGSQVIKTLQAEGIMAVAKHFPGIGRTVMDSHFHLPVLEADLDLLEKSDIVPFMDAGENDVCGIMLSHISYPLIDEKWQASLSPVIAHDLLRKKIGFNGIVMTDDLDMKAIRHDMKTCVEQILISGIDIALICHKGPDIDIAFGEIKRRIGKEEKLYHSCKKSFKRVLKYKKKYLSYVY